jgi:hydrogenase nickel incorporation protein HypB
MAILDKNDREAARVREWLRTHNVKAINIMSSPGSGKTTLLRKTLEKLSSEMNIAVLVGDQTTDNDARRLMGVGGRVKQLNTHSACHLDAAMIAAELDRFITPDLDLLIIENVGNLVCPAAFDLGEQARIALLSVCEGEDKPAKYPVLFHKAQLVVLTKTDLMPYLTWSESECLKHISSVNNQVEVLKVSTKEEQTMDSWLQYLRQLVSK